MAAIASFTPETKRLYLSKRKKVGVLATEKWGPEFPKFNSPQMKAELNEFSAKIAPICSIPEVGFNEEGIAKHIQDFCNEQRRYLKLKRSKSASSEDNEVDDQPTKKKIQQKILTNDQDDIKPDESEDETNSDNRSVASSKSSEQDDLNSSTGFETSKDLSVGEESPSCSQAPKALADNKNLNLWPLKTNQIIVKAVFGNVLSRDDAVNVLKKKFSVQPKNLTALSPIQLLQVLAKKLVNNIYCTISKVENINSLRKSDISVLKEIEI